MDYDELLAEVREGLKAFKGPLTQIEKDIEGVSYSWLSAIKNDSYKSDPAYKRLVAVKQYLETHSEARA